MIVGAIAVVAILVLAVVLVMGMPDDGEEGSDRASAPQHLSINYADDYIVANWDEPLSNGSSEIATYKVYCSAGNPVNFTCNWTVDGRWHSKVLYTNDLHIGWTYSLCVAAINSAGEGARSEMLTFALYLVPGRIYDAEHAWGDGFVDVRWTPPASDGGKPITGYTVQRHEWGEEEDTTTFFNVSASANSYNDTTASNGVRYVYEVRAKNQMGLGRGTAIYVIPGAPAEVTDLIQSPGNGFVELVWAPPFDGGSPITKYVVERYLWQQWSAPQFSVELPGSAESYNDTGVINDVGYTFKVIAFNDLGGRGNDFGSGGYMIKPSADAKPSSWPYPVNDYQVGDYVYYEQTMAPSYGGGLAWVMNYTITKVTSLTFTLNSTEICVMWNNLTYYDDELRLKAGTFGASLSDAELIGTEMVDTNWGQLAADHWRTSDAWGGTYEIWIHDGVLIKEDIYNSGALGATKVLVRTNLTQITG
jgi:hypothetical protein